MKRKKIRTIALVILALLVVFLLINHNAVRITCSNLLSPKVKLDTAKEWTGGTSYEHVKYSDISDNTYLHLYVPKSAKPVPLLILVHGGGYIFNDLESRQAQFMYRYFRDHGYACATINYRLAQEAPFPGALQDVKTAIRFLRANADTYGYDPEKFAIWGESAGGYLAIIAGVTNDEEFTDIPFAGETEADEDVSANVRAIADFYGCAEFGIRNEQFKEEGIPYPLIWFGKLWLKDGLSFQKEFQDVESYWLRRHWEDMTEEERCLVQPEYYIKKNFSTDSDLHMLIWHGDADLDVPYLQSEHLYHLMQETIRPEAVQYKRFHNYKHAADRFYADDSLAEMKQWLDEVFAS